MIICVDFDGTLVERTSGELQLRPGADRALKQLAGKNELILHSCRLTRPNESSFGRPIDDTDWELYFGGYLEMRRFLEQHGLWKLFDRVWEQPGKPVADLYVDDLASKPDWDTIGLTFG